MSKQTGLPLLYCRRSDGGIQTWRIEVDYGTFRTISGLIDGNKVVSAWTQCVAKRGKTVEQQAEAEARALWKKQQDSGYRTDVKDIDTATFFAPMLAHVFDDYPEMVTAALARGEKVYLQPKLDGMRALAQEGGLTSRNGKDIVSAPHIHAAVKHVFGSGFVTDGELYADKFADDFNKIISLAKKSKPTAADLAASKAELQYHIYDYPSAPGSFSERLKALKAKLNSRANMDEIAHPLIMVETVQITRFEEIEEHFGIWRGKGYEGAMIRLDGEYEQKRSKNLLKYKKFAEEEFTIKDVSEGKGNRAGMAGFFTFATAAGKEFTAAPMGNVSLFKRMLADRKKLIGKVATIQYFNMTPDGLPRFPYVKAIRDYE